MVDAFSTRSIEGIGERTESAFTISGGEEWKIDISDLPITSRGSERGKGTYLSHSHAISQDPTSENMIRLGERQAELSRVRIQVERGSSYVSPRTKKEVVSRDARLRSENRRARERELTFVPLVDVDDLSRLDFFSEHVSVAKGRDEEEGRSARRRVRVELDSDERD